MAKKRVAHADPKRLKVLQDIVTSDDIRNAARDLGYTAESVRQILRGDRYNEEIFAKVEMIATDRINRLYKSISK